MRFRDFRLPLCLALLTSVGATIPAHAETNITRLVVLFESSKSTLNAAGLKEVESFAELLKRHPQLSKIEVQGHCDHKEAKSPRLRMRLSTQRAESVRQKLIGFGIKPIRLVVKGYADQRPVSVNSSDDAVARNRRVSLKILDIGPGTVTTPPKRKPRRGRRP